MLLKQPTIAAFEEATGWHVRPEGLCRDEGDWLSDVQQIGAENYYPPLRLSG